MHHTEAGGEKPLALSLLSAQRPRNVSWRQAAGLLFGDWGTSRLYVLGLALFYAGRSSFYLIIAMSGLILAVGWAYSQICRIYPDGGGVYTAAKSKSRILAVIGALLLFADYTVTASLSGLDAFHYFGLGGEGSGAVAKNDPKATVTIATTEYNTDPAIDAGDHLDAHRNSPSSAKESLWSLKSPGFWAIVALLAIGLFNLMGPKHTGGFAIAAAVGMVFITLLITAFALPQVPWHDLPHRIGTLNHHAGPMWVSFVSIVLALSGVEAIANLTGVMERPVARTASKAIWVVAAEVAIFNILLAVFMLAIFPINRDAHLADMAAYLTGFYVGPWGEWGVRIIGGVLLLSACNTAITDMISVQYLMARDGELPQMMTRLNRFGVPWMPAVVAASVPIIVLMISHDLDSLAALYAIGVIGAVAINVSLCSIHPRLRKLSRKIPMMLLGAVLLGIWVTLAYVKHEALIFVAIVMVIGLSGRTLTKLLQRRRGERRSLLEQAINDQLTPAAMSKQRILVGTYGSDAIAPAALREAQQNDALLVVCFIREVQLSYKYDAEQALTINSDQAALRVFTRFLDLAHTAKVPVLPIYDTGPDAAVLMAENAALHGCSEVLIGSSRQGMLYHLIKGHFQRRLESLLPPEIRVKVSAVSVNGSIDQDVVELT